MIILEKKTGERLTLGCQVNGVFHPSISLTGWQDSSDIPGVAYAGRDGETVYEEDVRTGARALTARGWLRADSEADLEALIDQLSAWLNSKQELKLFRHTDDTKFMWVRKANFSHDYVPRTGRCACNISINFKASNPYRYATNETTATLTAVGTAPQTVNVVNPGSVSADPVIVIEPRAGGSVTSPKITNLATGRTCEIVTLITSADTVTLDSDQRTALKGSVNILPAVSEDFLVYGHPLLPGTNSVKIEAPAASGTWDVTFTFRPRWY
jgi:phage-related protein